jgi:hypothetical protein
MLAIYTIYQNPADHPGKFVVRRFVIDADKATPDADVIVCDSLVEARFHIPLGLFNLKRQIGDAPQIVESWV